MGAPLTPSVAGQEEPNRDHAKPDKGRDDHRCSQGLASTLLVTEM